jgi:hypothetical protein
MKEVSEIKRELLSALTAHNVSENNSSLLREKLHELSEVHRVTIEDFHQKDKQHALVSTFQCRDDLSKCLC